MPTTDDGPSRDQPTSIPDQADAPESRIKVLVVEDEEPYREAISSGLRQEGFAVELAADGEDGLRRFSERPPDIVLLDVLLPGMRGTEVCRRMRAIAPVPILMVSAIASELDVVLALELGAAGYVAKPFHLRELVARMQAILRRMPPSAPASADRPDARAPAPDRSDIRVGQVRVSFSRREVTVAGTTVHLTRREFDLLSVLLSPPAQLRTRDELIRLVWPDPDLTDSRTLDTHIHRLRTKLGFDRAAPPIIVTVRGVGFRLDVVEPQAPKPRT